MYTEKWKQWDVCWVRFWHCNDLLLTISYSWLRCANKDLWSWICGPAYHTDQRDPDEEICWHYREESDRCNAPLLSMYCGLKLIVSTGYHSPTGVLQPCFRCSHWSRHRKFSLVFLPENYSFICSRAILLLLTRMVWLSPSHPLLTLSSDLK